MAHYTGHRIKSNSSEASQSFSHFPIPPFLHLNATISAVSPQAIASLRFKSVIICSGPWYLNIGL